MITAAIDGPTARARLATDCITPSTLPCWAALALLEARLVNDGAASALPIADSAPTESRPSKPMAGFTNGLRNKLIVNNNPPTMTRFGSPKRLTSFPISPPWTPAEMMPTKAKIQPLCQGS